MSMLDIHQQALEDTPDAYHEFLQAYKKGRKCIYGFVEGKTDPSYYANKVQGELPDGWEVDFWHAGGKKKAIKVFESFEWTRFKKGQVLFFFDRDFSPWVPEHQPEDVNIYVTDCYSIENTLVTKDVCKRVLQDLKGMEELCGEEMDNVLDVFGAQLQTFYKYAREISVHMIAWHRKGDAPCAENLKMQDIFEFVDGKIRRISKPKGTSGIAAYMCKKFNLSRRGLGPHVENVERELDKEPDPKRYIRGKYELWFLLEFCEHISRNPKRFSSKIKVRSKLSCDLCLKNAVCIVGPQVRTPKTLREFLSRTAFKFASSRRAV